jgi:hypothetical protein
VKKAALINISNILRKYVKLWPKQSDLSDNYAISKRAILRAIINSVILYSESRNIVFKKFDCFSLIESSNSFEYRLAYQNSKISSSDRKSCIKAY